MSKKKQLAGKKTKLAKLPLTAALSRQLEEASPYTVAVSPETEDQQLSLSWERLEEGAAGLLTAAYVLVIQDLMHLKAEFPWVGDGDSIPHDLIPRVSPPPQQVKQALRQTREELAALHRLLTG